MRQLPLKQQKVLRVLKVLMQHLLKRARKINFSDPPVADLYLGLTR